MARLRAGKLRHMWRSDDPRVELKLCLYRSACCSILRILTYGSEAWILELCIDDETKRIIDGLNALMSSNIYTIVTGKRIEQGIRSTRYKNKRSNPIY